MKNVIIHSQIKNYFSDRIFFFLSYNFRNIFFLICQMSGTKNSSKLRNQQQASIMSQNVTPFKHFLSHSYITQKDIKWAINLRQYQKIKLKQAQSTPPPVYYKSTQLQQIRKKDSAKNFYNTGQFDHFMSSKRGKKYPELDIMFHTNLRASQKDAKNLKDRFLTIPKKDRKQYPNFLNLKSIKKTKNIENQNLQSAFDGAQNYPKYHERKILADKNIVNFEHLVRGKVNLPGIAWHVGLRKY